MEDVSVEIKENKRCIRCNRYESSNKTSNCNDYKYQILYEPTYKLGLFDSAPLANVKWEALNTSALRSNAKQSTNGSEAPSTITSDLQGNLYITMALGALNGGITKRTVYKFDNTGTIFLLDLNIPSIAGDSFRGITYNSNFDRLFLIVGSNTTPKILTFKTDGTDVKTYANFSGTTGFINDLVFDKMDNLYVTDSGTFTNPNPSAKGKIYFIPKQNIDTNINISVPWSVDPLLSPNVPYPSRFTGANGLALDNRQKTLYVSVTETGTIIKIKINEDGSASEAKIFVQDPKIKLCDGMKIDIDKNIWLAGGGLDSVVKIDKNGIITFVAQGYPVLDYPSSVLITRDNKYNKEIFVVNSSLARNAVINTSTYVPGPQYQHLGKLTYNKINTH